MSLLGSTAAISRMASAPDARALNTWYACGDEKQGGGGGGGTGEGALQGWPR